MEIEVVDEIMGTGKSHTTLRYIENLALNDTSEKWIFCTEYLSEIDQRTKENAEAAHLWRTPVDDGANKTENLKQLLSEPDVQLIGITHNLLVSASKDSYINYLIKHNGYKLFLDETIELLNVYTQVKFGDFTKCYHRKELLIDDFNYGKVEWIAEDESGLTGGHDTSTDRLKIDSAKGIVYCARRDGIEGGKDSVSLVEVTNEIIFKQFKRVIIATYQIEDTLFDAYLSMKGIKKVKCADVSCTRTTTKAKISSLITFVGKFDNLFIGDTILSSRWYNSETRVKAAPEDFKAINKAIKSIGDKNGCKGSAHLLGFTVPSDKLGKQRDSKKIQPVGYPHTVCSVIVDAEGIESEGPHSKALSTYVPCNARASNEYANKVVMIHAYNRYPIQPVLNYLTYHKVRFSSERFALNEIVQWVWRCAIRNGEPIKLAILSSRMRNLFKDWLNN